MGPRSIVCVCWQRHRTWWGRIYYYQYPRWHAEQERKTKKKKRKKKEGRCKMNMKTKI